MWSTTVEADTGEILAVLDPEGFIRGNGLLTFQAPLDLYCSGVATQEEIVWFSKIDSFLDDKLCELVRPFLDSIYSGDWSYEEDEYEFYAYRHVEPESEEDFNQGLARAKSSWKDINLVRRGIEQLLKAFKEVTPEDTLFYNPEIVVEFESLDRTLELLSQRRAEKIRINIH